jgi:O-antigen/teichoic acid export membrane protein
MHFTRSIAANLVGKLWSGLANFVFVPFYIRYLGIEAYGLVGFFASLLAIFALLDMGAGTALSRQLATFAVTPGEPGRAATLVRSLEYVYLLIAVLLGAGTFLAAPWLAHTWLNPVGLSLPATITALRLMAVVAALRWPVALYTAALVGLQRQVALNVLTTVVVTLQGVGALVVLQVVSPTIQAFFTWQVAVAAMQLCVFLVVVWRSLGGVAAEPRFSTQSLRQIVRFAAGVAGITGTSILLTQADKVILSKYLPLQEFGYYTLSWSIANVFSLVSMAFYTGLLPSLAQLTAPAREQDLIRLYHRGCQLLAVLTVPAAFAVAFFSEPLLKLYIRSPEIAFRSHGLLSVLVIGNLLLSMMVLPLALQLAHGWTKLSLYKNIVAVMVFVPAMSLVVPRFGALGAAWLWLGLTAGYFLIEIPIMHRRLLRREKWKWYLADVGIPVVISVVTLGAARWILVGAHSDLFFLRLMAAAIATATLLSIAASSQLRSDIRQSVFGHQTRGA